MDTKIDEVKKLSNYLEGYADSVQNEKIKEASKWLWKLSVNMCGQGIIGCTGGDDCRSSHK